jgi:hypothetical protein
MTHEIALIVDIQTILKMLKFNDNFRNLFKKLSFLAGQFSEIIDDYVVNSDIISKNKLWSILSTVEYIPEVNYIIKIWRRDEEGSEKIEKDMEMMTESSTGHSIVGKVIQFGEIQDIYQALVLEERKQNFLYNGFKILPHGDNFLQLFF